MLEGKLITIPALGHQNKGKSSFTGSVLFVLMSHYGNNNELALQHGGFCTTWSLVAKGLLKVIPRGGWKLHEMSCKQERTTAILRFHRLTTFYTCFWSHFSSKASLPLKLALPCASVRALVAIVALAYSTEFCRFLSLLVPLIFVDHCFHRLFCQLSA